MGKIMVTKSSLPEFDEYVEEIKSIWQTHWLTNMGDKHKELEERLKDYLCVNNINLFVNGHMALESIIAAYQLEGEVITTPFTFASTTHAIVRNGLKPVFCDINNEDYTINTDKIESLITDKTCAIIPVHVYGNVCDVKKIQKIAKKYNLKVIYDAAHTFGTKVNGKGIGSFGDASIFSFHATKVFNTIEGGAVTYNDDNLYKVLNDIKNFGITGPEDVDYVGGNAKMNEFQAAMGLCNLRHIDSEIHKRKKVYDRYIERLVNIEGIKLCRIRKNVTSNYSYMPVLFDGYTYDRNQVFDKLEENNIIARKYFYPLTNEFECYKDMFDVGYTPVAKYVSERILCLPLYADLSLNDVDRICDIILEQ